MAPSRAVVDRADHLERLAKATLVDEGILVQGGVELRHDVTEYAAGIPGR